MSQLPTGGRRRRRRLWIIIAIILLLIILLLLLFFFPRPTATVTLTPERHSLSTSRTESIEASNLSSQESGSQTGDSSGPPKPGTQAMGTLTFQNYTPDPVTIPAGTSVTSSTGQEVVTDETITVPPDPIIPGVASASAHAVKVGTSGNIDAMSVNTTCCSSDNIKVFNESAFTGGTDNQTAHTVLQSDVDKVATSLEPSLTQKAQGDIQKQLNSGEKLVTTPPQCSTNVIANPAVGESADKFTATVSVSCSDAAYNPQTALSDVEDQLKHQAAQQFPGFVLDGTITSKVDQATLGQDGIVDLQVSATGTWKYHFTDAVKLDMKKHIARETKSAARVWLLQQKGVADASISVTGPIIDLSGGNTLPDDLSAITING
jgi:hypothetical protein